MNQYILSDKNVAHMRYSRPDSGLSFTTHVLKLSPLRSEEACPPSPPTLSRSRFDRKRPNPPLPDHQAEIWTLILAKALLKGTSMPGPPSPEGEAQDCYSRKATMGWGLMAPRSDRTTRISSPVIINHEAKGSAFVNLTKTGNLNDCSIRPRSGR